MTERIGRKNRGNFSHISFYGGQNLERTNSEELTFRKTVIVNMKKTKDELKFFVVFIHIII